ncbi:MAG TPA: tetratricopeptide repeat protein [Coriobacteriia bacterium]
MAIDKSSAPAWVKGVIIFVAVTFVISIGIPFIGSLSSPPTSTGTQTGQGSTTATDTLAGIAGKYSARTIGVDEALKKDPKNYDLLLAQAQTYQDWAGEIAQSTAGTSGADRPLWMLSVDYYKRALAVKPGDPNATTDSAIAQFYSGDTSGAVTTAEGVAKANPTFAQVQFNLGVFYSASGDNAKGIAAYEAYVKLAPKGDLVGEANNRIAQLKKPVTPSIATTP